MTPSHAIDQLGKSVNILTAEPMARHTSFRVGGPAQYLALPTTVDQVKQVIQAARAAELPITLLGGGSNILVSDQGIGGMVLGLTKFKSGIHNPIDQTSFVGRIRAEAGHRLASVCRFAAKNGLAGLESLAGIPGTLGGAVAMNAGSAHWGIGECIHTLTVMDKKTLEMETLSKGELIFNYRHLDLPGKIILAVELDLTPGNPDQIQAAHDKALAVKKASQPVSKASGGCFFKNPSPSTPAGKLIDQAGLKGTAVNQARVSHRHANFIVNDGQARCQDILSLAQLVQDRVMERFNIPLEPEIKVIENG